MQCNAPSRVNWSKRGDSSIVLSCRNLATQAMTNVTFFYVLNVCTIFICSGGLRHTPRCMSQRFYKVFLRIDVLLHLKGTFCFGLAALMPQKIVMCLLYETTNHHFSLSASYIILGILIFIEVPQAFISYMQTKGTSLSRVNILHVKS